MKNVLKLLLLTIFIVMTLMLASCKMRRFVYYNFANITDYKIFPYRTAKNDSIKFTFETLEKQKAPRTLTFGNKEYGFDEYLKKNKTVAFLIIKNDTLLCEKYFNGYSEASIVNSFSMAKSVTSILIGCAIDDGFIRSVEEPVIKYVPELTGKGMDEMSIKNLLQMTSGMKYNESYVNPFGDAATYYYGTNLRKALNNRETLQAPGTEFSYSSGDTQMLGLVLERALEGKNITEYLQEKLWKPLGMEYDATWSLDRRENGLEKTFCCLNARARDFAKIGRLYLNKGKWDNKQIVSKEWVDVSTTADTLEGGAPHYKYQWWLEKDGNYMAQGILGQYIYVVPKKNMIIVRLGKDYGNAKWESIFYSLSNLY
ncbi:serine hydrolase domain-containing protein [Flavobacterium psychrotrophum]|uniref:serine hydrolase domain-containing protein n=1 Tax=Flavobacterium psychrotrophum TaxID=2294119 RepID=UPI000E31D13E|nr:serine hydrolase [Flavobacterium psychrotrophum]